MRILVSPLKGGRSVCDDGNGGGYCGSLSPCIVYGGYVYGSTCF